MTHFMKSLLQKQTNLVTLCRDTHEEKDIFENIFEFNEGEKAVSCSMMSEECFFPHETQILSHIKLDTNIGYR